MAHADVLSRFAERARAGLPCALVTVTSSEGSVPREVGAQMLVLPDGSIEGTIGGGRLEAKAIEEALDAMKEGAPRASSYELEPQALGMYCGGKVGVFIDVSKARPKVLILGGGHVGEAVARLAAFLGLPHSVVDDRPEFARPERYPQAAEVLTAQPDEALKRLGVDEKTSVVIVTRCHGFDLRCLAAALGTPAAYIGMIGSRRKVERLFGLCRRRGLDPEQPRVHAPIGLDLGGRSPEEIALSVLAEVQMSMSGATGLPLSRKSEAAKP